MLPDAPRADFARTLRAQSELIEQRLPRRVRADDIFLPWETVAPLLLARIAGQGRTLATLIDAGHDLDAEMVMRSLLEHATLFSWLAVEPDGGTRTWKARRPDDNTLWWMLDQYAIERNLTEKRHQWLGGVLDDDLRAALRAMKQRVAHLPHRGQFPSVEQMAEEVDLHWGRRLAGWAPADPRTPGFAATFRGHYWTLYTRGSTSVHPDYGAIRRFLRPPAASGDELHDLVREQHGESLGVFLGMSVFLMGEAMAVADAALGWDAYDDVLRMLGRWDEVRAPDLLVGAALMTFDDGEGRLYTSAEGKLVSIEILGGELAIVVVEEGGRWDRLRHPLGTRDWYLDDGSIEQPVGAAGADREMGPLIAERIDLLAAAHEAPWSRSRPAAWPADAP